MTVKTKKRPSSDISGFQTGSAVIQAQGSEVSNSASIRTISPNTEKGKTNFKILSSEPSLETLCKATKDIKPQTNRKRRATSDKGMLMKRNPECTVEIKRGKVGLCDFTFMLLQPSRNYFFYQSQDVIQI